MAINVSLLSFACQHWVGHPNIETLSDTLLTPHTAPIDGSHVAGSAILALSTTKVPSSNDLYKSCIIEDLVLDQDPNKLDKMAIFVGLFRQIQELCLNRNIMHLALARRPGGHWYAGLLTQAGSQHCECDRPGELTAASPICFPLYQFNSKPEARRGLINQVQLPAPQAEARNPHDPSVVAEASSPLSGRGKKVYCT